ncbi:chromate transporter [Paenibacillus planticolens]|uniref:Chromate transporter n=1 Tax=Paenibacillus planticolens TaxID=2654976 RepID=A0ABX1ZLF3_9BACL|nr:chromate transporter [Paenibacillus planticolens]NOU99583.1 chromate transporter [Paenibacillus planticolens]
MMEWWHLFVSFFLSNVFGYGGGPSSIPLMYQDIVTNHNWMTSSEFSNMLALGNALPGPIATKIAAYVGYEIAGWVGVLITVAATVVPSIIALIILLNILQKYKQSPVIKGMTLLVQPVIAIMMVLVTWSSLVESTNEIGYLQFFGIATVAFYLIQMKKVHPAFVIVVGFVYGGIFLS